MRISDKSRYLIWKRTFLVLKIVLLTAMGVGGATVFGAVFGFVFKKLSEKYKDVTLGAAAGVMLAASVFSLVLPALGDGGVGRALAAVFGIFCGGAAIDLLDRAVGIIQSRAAKCKNGADFGRRRALLFVLAIAVHNLPEGIAAGVGFGTGNTADALMIAGGIALQNVPEGMVLVAPMLSAGFSPRKTFLLAAMTGAVEIVGAFLGYFAVSAVSEILEFALAFAGGCMLYVIFDEMIPEAREGGGGKAVTYAAILGFSSMLIFNALF
jgi:ZIP family zinc transporter